ncbi:20735_t:CDS:2 [Gigaspora rosea]|nr:20735_t:CDS:2 [Gigaspora rosea]
MIIPNMTIPPVISLSLCNSLLSLLNIQDFLLSCKLGGFFGTVGGCLGVANSGAVLCILIIACGIVGIGLGVGPGLDA